MGEAVHEMLQREHCSLQRVGLACEWKGKNKNRTRRPGSCIFTAAQQQIIWSEVSVEWPSTWHINFFFSQSAVKYRQCSCHSTTLIACQLHCTATV